MTNIVTADDFITGVLCELLTAGQNQIKLLSTMADKRFEAAYEELVRRAPEFDIKPDFSLMTNPYHGDSETLRETLYAARDRRIVAINNPTFKTVEITLDNQDVEEHFADSPLPREFYAELVKRHFKDSNGEVGTPRGTE